MEAESKWEGKSKGGLAGHRIFVFILKTFGLRFSYLIVRFVSLHFFLFSKSTKSSFKYFREIHHYGVLKSLLASYKNYFVFGQVLLDKVAMLSGMSDNFIIEHDGYEENLMHLRNGTKGSILLSAHVGNWEIAGHKLERLKTKFNILMYDNEIAGMNDYMKNVLKEKKFNMIAIKDGEMGHLVELHKVFSNNELLVMHGDRFLPGSETIDKLFLGKMARFPAGPFLLASKFGVPITIVFSMKEKGLRYHFYARKAIDVKRCRTKEEIDLAIKEASDKYIEELEKIVKKYPTQWFNFYDFWT